jgi:hypothetical protein
MAAAALQANPEQGYYPDQARRDYDVPAGLLGFTLDAEQQYWNLQLVN